MPDSTIDRIFEAAGTIPFTSILKGDQSTCTIMDIFGKLGHSLAYRVNCHSLHYPAADDGEWMYDMMWYTEKQGDRNKFFTSMPMVLEAELRRKTKQGNEIDADFKKLVQARANVRVWISTSPNNAQQHIDNCKKQIQLFSGTAPGDQYVFAVYDWKSEKPIIEKFIVS
jgi:hypothetical protein